MGLDESYQSRDYLFGRLLALADKVERIALSSNESKRLTTAERYLQRFSDKPALTWKTITENLVPYQQRLHAKFGSWHEVYANKISEVTNMMTIEDINSEKKLTPEFLLGFHSQKIWLNERTIKKGEWLLNSENDSENGSENNTENKQLTV